MTDPLERATPHDLFRANLTFARGMITGGEAIEKIKQVGLISEGTLVAAHPEDLYRAAWSQAVSAMEHWLHLEIPKRAAILVRSVTTPRPQRLLKLKLPFAAVDGMLKKERGEVLHDYLTEELRRDSYHSVEGITRGVQLLTDDSKDMIWGKVAQAAGMSLTEAKEFHDSTIAARRNSIAHQADLDSQGQRRPMRADEAREAVDWIDQLADVLTHYVCPR
ncbi:hypothetical protein [Planomonospora algeriensis]